MQYIREKLFTQINRVNYNKVQFSKYLYEIKGIKQFGRFDSPIARLKRDRLIKIEDKIIKQRICSPIIRFYLTVTLNCATINGKIYSRKRETFDADDILSIANRLNDKTGNFYNDSQIWEALCRVERGKVSNRMRFSVYERDGYRCRKCGVSDREAQLEIDHIIPISKGGKSTFDNLQTLCHKCNVEKGDNYKLP